MPHHFGALGNQEAGEERVLAGWTTVRNPSPGAAPVKFGAGSPMMKAYDKWGSSSARTFHAVGSIMLVVLWLHPSWVRHDNLQSEADIKAKMDFWKSSHRARGQEKDSTPCCPPGHQEDLFVHSDIFLATSPSSLAWALVSALVLHRELRTSV